MTKTMSIVLVCILSLLILFFGIFTFLPDGIEYGKYNVYHAPVNLIQKGSDLGESVNGTYKIEADEFAEGVTAENSNLVKLIQKRLGNIFGYNNVPVKISDGRLDVTVPKTSDETKTTAEAILTTVTAKGVLEVVTEQTYSEDKVILSNTDEEPWFSSVKTERYVNGGNSYNIVTVKLSDAGLETIKGKITESTSAYAAYGAVDGQVIYGIIYSGNNFQFYTNGIQDSKALASYIKNGALDAALTEIDVLPVEGSGIGLTVSAIVLAALILGICVFFAVRYGFLGLAGILSLLIAAVAFTMFAGLAYFSVMNVYALIGIILSLALFTYLTCSAFEKIRAGVGEGKSFGASSALGFNKCIKENVIINSAVLVLGIILWVIPTMVTVSLGNVLVYAAVLSFATTLGLNRLFAKLVYPLGEENPASYGIRK